MKPSLKPVLLCSALLINNYVFGDAATGAPQYHNLVRPMDESRGFFLTGGFLLEQVRVTGAQYAYTKNGNAIGGTALPASGEVLVPNFDITWGFTGGFAYYFEEKNWTVSSRFDWLSSTGKGTNIADSDSNVIPINLWRDQFFSATSSDLGVAGFAKSHFEVSYYNVNIDLNRALYIDRNFSIEPHMGFKLSFIYDEVKSEFSRNGSDTSFASTTHLNSNELKRRQGTNFWGIGPSMGVNTNWDLCSDLSLFFEGATSVLLGYSKAEDHLSYSALANSETDSYSPHISVFSPTLQTLLGLKYEKAFFQNTQRIIARIGWDTTFFWNQWNHINTVSEGTFNSSIDTFQLKEGDTFGLSGLLLNVTYEF